MSGSETGKTVHNLLAILIPFVLYAIIVIAGNSFTSYGVAFWYNSLAKTSSMPAEGLISSSWTGVYILCAVSFSLFLSNAKHVPSLWIVLGLYFLNAIFHCGWTSIFFLHHLPGVAAVISFLSGATLIVIMVFTWPSSRASSLLLFPYLLWASLATYFSYAVYRLNS